MNGARAGFTLVELIVVVMIVGVLAAFAVPQYRRTVESSKAEEAMTVAKQVAAANRLFKLDRGVYVPQGNITNACNTGTCPAAAPYNVCDLVRCKYLAAQNWDSKGYNIGAGVGNGCLGTFGIGFIGCVARKSGSSPGTNTAPYSGWMYKVDAAGTVDCEPACGTADAPPSPG